jgi:hypothetical protein
MWLLLAAYGDDLGCFASCRFHRRVDYAERVPAGVRVR